MLEVATTRGDHDRPTLRSIAPAASADDGNGPVSQLLREQHVRYAGLAITALALGLVFWSIYASDLLRSDDWLRADLLVGVVVSALIFSLSLCCVFVAWYLVVMSVSSTHVSWLDGFGIYAISQIYKYIPSNVVHHVGRYYMLRRRGVDHAAATWGFLAETALIIVAALLVALAFGAPLIREALGRLGANHGILFGVAAVALAAALAAAVFLHRRRMFRELLRPFLRMQVLYAGIAALLLHIAARLISGFALWWLVAEMLHEPLSLWSAIAVWAAAWTLGYLTPGATAGLGVREAVLIALLVALKIPMSDATLLAIAFRVATTLGDLVFAGMGLGARYLAGTPAQPYQDLQGSNGR